jgi:hypothetical protein
VIYNLAYDIALRAVVRIQVEAETLEEAECAAFAAIEKVECADLNFSPAPGVLFTEATTCNLPPIQDLGPLHRPQLFEVNGEAVE